MHEHDDGSRQDGRSHQDTGSRQQRFPMGFVLMALVILTAFRALFFGPHAETLPYSDFKKLVVAGKVSELTLSRDAVRGTLPPKGLEGLLPADRIAALKKYGDGPHGFITNRVDDPQLTSQLEAANVRFTGEVENTWWSALLGWLLPIAFFFGLWTFMAGRMGAVQGGLMAVGKSKAKVYMERSTGVSFEDVAGIDEARAELMEIVDFLKNPAHYRRLGGKIPKGVLLVGAPGTGKTLLAKAVAGEAGVPFFSLSGSDFVEMFVGVGAARVRDLFTQAQAHAPSIIFIDELDALGKARGISPMVGSHDEREQTLNQLLKEMDGFDTQKGVMLMAATNRPEILDPALLRPGRFDRKVVIDRPDLHGREKILKVHSRNVTLGPDVDLSVIAARTPGFVGADLANLVNEAALNAARTMKDQVEMTDFDVAIDRVVAGLERKSRVINPKEKAIVAYHEAGHALVAESRQYADRVAKISIIPRGIGALGYTQQQPTEDRYLMMRAELLDRLDVLLGGRVAEEIVFRDVSTGAQDDLRRATDIVRHMVAEYGMSSALGLATLDTAQHAAFLQIPNGGDHSYSDETSRLIDEEMRTMLNAAHDRARETLLTKRQTLDALATLLIEKEVVDRDALARLLKAPETTAENPASTPSSAAVRESGVIHAA